MHKYYKIALAALATLSLVALLVSQFSPESEPRLDTIPDFERRPIETKRPNIEIMKIAHRGASKFAPENTLPALEKAIELGFEYIEIDVRETRDGVAVLMHEDQINHTTNGTGRISDLSLKELKELDAGSWFAEEFAGTRVPTLEEALKLIKGRACIFWDTKGSSDFAAANIELFKKYGFDRDCLLISFGGLGYADASFPKRIIQFWPDAPLMPFIANHEELTEMLAAYPFIRAVMIQRSQLTPELIDAAHAKGLLVATITLVQSDHHHFYQRAINEGVDIFMLDHIDSFYSYLETGDLDTPPAEALSKAGYFDKTK